MFLSQLGDKMLVEQSPYYRNLWVARLVEDDRTVFVTQGATRLTAWLNLWRRAYKAGYL